MGFNSICVGGQNRFEAPKLEVRGEEIKKNWVLAEQVETKKDGVSASSHCGSGATRPRTLRCARSGVSLGGAMFSSVCTGTVGTGTGCRFKVTAEAFWLPVENVIASKNSIV
jgi:hypothetical protein